MGKEMGNSVDQGTVPRLTPDGRKIELLSQSFIKTVNRDNRPADRPRRLARPSVNSFISFTSSFRTPARAESRPRAEGLR